MNTKSYMATRAAQEEMQNKVKLRNLLNTAKRMMEKHGKEEVIIRILNDALEDSSVLGNMCAWGHVYEMSLHPADSERCLGVIFDRLLSDNLKRNSTEDK